MNTMTKSKIDIKGRDAAIAAGVWQGPAYLHILFKWGWLSVFFFVCLTTAATYSGWVVNNWQTAATKRAEYSRLNLECRRQQTAKYGYFNRSSCHNYANNQVGLYAN